MIGFSLLSSVSKHNMWSYYDWVYRCWTTQSKYDHILCLLTDDNNNKPNHNTTTYCVYWRTTTTINAVIIRPCRPSVNTISGRIIIGLSLLSSVSKHNMWSYCDWVVFVVRQRPHCMFTDRRQQRQPNHNTTTYCVYWRKTATTQ
jgi:hypothetical protein